MTTRSWVLLGALGLIALAVLVVAGPRALYPPLPARVLADVKDAEKRIELQQAQASLENDTRALLVQAFGGLLLAAGAIATWRQLRISRDGQFTERFSRAIDQMGQKQLNVRLGAIYALERLAKNSRSDRIMIAAILAAFIRVMAPWPVGAPVDAPPHPTPNVEPLPWLDDRAATSRRPPSCLGDDQSNQTSRAWRCPVSTCAARTCREHTWPGSTCGTPTWPDHGCTGSCSTTPTWSTSTCAMPTCTTPPCARRSSARRTWTEPTWGADLGGADLGGADLTDVELTDVELTDIRADATTRWPERFSPPEEKNTRQGSG